jgi:UDP-N-acetylmuramate dehydrogenase
MILLQNIPLKKYSNFKIGGLASYFYEFKTTQALLDALSDWKEIGKDLPIFILGGGTNILFSDDGFEGLVLKDSLNFIKRDGRNSVVVGSGTLLSEFVSFCMQNSLSGFEWAGGLPGTVGGGVRGNAGAFGGEMKDDLIEVESIDIKTIKNKKRNNKECEFAYRKSIFKIAPGENEIILSAKFSLKKGEREEIKRKTQEKIDYRIDRHPLDMPNIGSTFKNVDVKKISKNVLKEFENSIKQDPFPVLPVAKLLIGANLKGVEIGGAKFSEKHPNFIVNFNNAKAKDVLALIKLAKKEIKEKYNIELEEEIMII